MAESRRMGVRRTVIGAAAAAVLLVAGVVGAASVWSDRGAAPVDPAVSDSPTPDQGPADRMEGTVLYYVGDEGIYSLTDNGRTETLIRGEPFLNATANVSPDGRYVSWVDTDRSLHLFHTAEKNDRVVLDGLDGSSCQEPVWSVNSYQILVKRDDGYGFFDITTDVFTPLGFDFGGACHVQLDERPGSGDPAIEREFMYIDRDAHELVHVDDKGERTGAVTNLIDEDTQIIGIQSRTDGGPYCFSTAAVDTSMSDTIRIATCETLGEFDGQAWQLVRTGTTPAIAATFAGDGVLVREKGDDGVVYFATYDEAGEQTWREAEVLGLQDWNLIAWR